MRTALRTRTFSLLISSEVRRTQELEPPIAKLAAGEAGALVVTADPFLEGEREVVAQMAAKHALAAISPTREYVEAWLDALGLTLPSTITFAADKLIE